MWGRLVSHVVMCVPVNSLTPHPPLHTHRRAAAGEGGRGRARQQARAFRPHRRPLPRGAGAAGPAGAPDGGGQGCVRIRLYINVCVNMWVEWVRPSSSPLLRLPPTLPVTHSPNTHTPVITKPPNETTKYSRDPRRRRRFPAAQPRLFAAARGDGGAEAAGGRRPGALGGEGAVRRG